MADPGLVVGITFLVFGTLMGGYGAVLCFTSKGSKYNAEDVDAMVQATVQAEESRRMKEEALFDDFKPGEMNKRRKVLVA